MKKKTIQLLKKHFSNTINIPVHLRYAKARYKSSLKEASFLLKKVKGKKMLDVGFATGSTMKAYSEKGFNVVGIDVDDEMIEIAKTEYHILKNKFRKYDGFHFPCKNNTFNLVNFTDTIEHCKDPQKVIKEIYRVLKPDGICHWRTECRWFPIFVAKNPHTGYPFTILLPYFLRKRIQPPGTDYIWFNSFNHVKSYFKKSGFKRVEQFNDIKYDAFLKLRVPKFLWGIYKKMIIQGIAYKI